jgi:hypothetical protein
MGRLVPGVMIEQKTDLQGRPAQLRNRRTQGAAAGFRAVRYNTLNSLITHGLLIHRLPGECSESVFRAANMMRLFGARK